MGPLFGIPVYFNNTVYFSAAHDQVKAFALKNGLLSTRPVSISNAQFAELGTVPSISANGASNGILWTIDPAGQLHAYDAADLSDQLYQGSVGTSVKFSTPTIANGKVYVGTADSLVVFGLQNEAPGSVAAIVNANGFQPGPAAAGSIVALFGSNLAPLAAQASSLPWPKVLEDTSVFINGTAAPLALRESHPDQRADSKRREAGTSYGYRSVRRPGFAACPDLNQKRARRRRRCKLRR